jgi:hypothetical protein
MLFEARKTGIPEDVVKAVVARTLRSKVEEINHTLAEIQHSITYFERNSTTSLYVAKRAMIWTFSNGRPRKS